MKKFLILLVFIPIISFSQEYSEIVEVPNKNKDQLYILAREWFAITFKSATDVLKMDDPVAGKLVGKGSFNISENYVSGGVIKVPITIDWNTNFTINISIKEGKYKCDITDIIIKSNIPQSGYPSTEVPFEQLQKQKEYFKNGSDLVWVKSNAVGASNMGKNILKMTAQSNQAHYNLVTQTENKFSDVMNSLKAKMTKTEDDW